MPKSLSLQDLIKIFSDPILRSGKLVKRTSLPDDVATMMQTTEPNLFGCVFDFMQELEVDPSDANLKFRLGKALANVLKVENNDYTLKKFGTVDDWKKSQNDFIAINFAKFVGSIELKPFRWHGWVIIAQNIQFGSIPLRINNSTAVYYGSNLGFFLTDDQCQKYLRFLLQGEHFTDLCQLLQYSRRIDLTNFKSLLTQLIKMNDVGNLSLILVGDRRLPFLEDMERKIAVLFNGGLQDKNIDSKQVSATGKVCRKMIINWNYQQLKFPYILLAQMYGQLNFVLKLVQKTLTSTGNPNFDTEEISYGIADVITGVLPKLDGDARTVLLNLLDQKLTRMQLFFLKPYILGLERKESEKSLNCDIIPSDYYTATSKIILLSEIEITNVINSVSEGLIIGIDCEWTDSDLALIQVCFDFKSGKETYLIDAVSIPGYKIEPLITKIFNCCTIVGFDISQDLSKINSYCNINPNQSAIVDLKPPSSQNCSLETLVLKVLGLKLDKRPRMTFWERRPMLYTQMLYAAGDAEVLVDLYNKNK